MNDAILFVQLYFVGNGQKTPAFPWHYNFYVTKPHEISGLVAAINIRYKVYIFTTISYIDLYSAGSEI